jgi:hypothetical protein
MSQIYSFFFDFFHNSSGFSSCAGLRIEYDVFSLALSISNVSRLSRSDKSGGGSSASTVSRFVLQDLS